MNDLLARIAQLQRILELAHTMQHGTPDEAFTARLEIARIVGTEIGALRYELRQFETAMAPVEVPEYLGLRHDDGRPATDEEASEWWLVTTIADRKEAA